MASANQEKSAIQELQELLEKEVFYYAKDKKKAAGRGLGTFVEIITYYLLKAWGFNNNISIERGLEEYGNPEITHNVEYSLHPIVNESFLKIKKDDKSLTAKRIYSALRTQEYQFEKFAEKSNILLTRLGILRNACTIGVSKNEYLLCSIKDTKDDELELHIYEQSSKIFAMFECKRVGVEEGMKKGPQTIEKAKQGAYVANTVSALQKVRTEHGEMHGIIYRSDNTHSEIKPYVDMMEEVIYSNDAELLRRFILTVGIVSNHGNWFSSDNMNKELKVLAQSYDWLIFLTDEGLAEFINSLVRKPEPKYLPIRQAFTSSYAEGKKKNQFTKVQMNLLADTLLQEYFTTNISKIEKWFNVISPKGKSLDALKMELTELKNKEWKTILQN